MTVMPAKTRPHRRPQSGRGRKSETAGSDSLFQSIKPLVESLQALNQQAVTEYAPVVDDILRSRSRDTQHIEHTLDGLLDFCGYEPALVLFKKLCRHYWEIDPVATARQINAYREFWDSDENEDGKSAPHASSGGGV